MASQEIITKVDAVVQPHMDPSLADLLIYEAHEGPFSPKLGTAQWANPFVAAADFPYESGSIWLGRNPVNADQAMGYKDDRHVLISAGTRTGKGRSMIVNNLALWPGSICAIDPKGENATVLANRRGDGSVHCDGLGQDVFVFDPFRCAKVPNHMRAYFDPLSTLEPNDRALPRKVGRIAEATTIMPDGESAEWTKRGRQMITTVILHVMTSPDFEGHDEHGRPWRSLITVRRLLTAGDSRAYQHFKDMGVSPIPSAMELLWDSIAHNPACDGIVSDQGQSYFQSFQHHREYFESVIKSAAENTAWIDEPDMRDTLVSGPRAPKRFHLNDLKSDAGGQSIFLCLPVDDMPAYGRWQRVMIACIISEMQQSQGLPVNGHPLLMCLDEFPALGAMERLEKAAAEIAGAGVKLMTVVQNLPQLKKLYKDSWETFLGNSALQIFFGIDDNTTREYLQKALGETEVVKYQRTVTRGTNRQDTEGVTEGTSQGTTHSTSRGGNTTWSHSKGRNQNWGSSDSVGSNWSRGQSGGSNTNWGSGRSGGSNTGWSRSTGSSEGESWQPGLFFSNRQSSNRGTNQSNSISGGANSGWSTQSGGGTNSGWSEQTGGNRGRTTNRGEGRNYSDSRGGGENWSSSEGTSEQRQHSEQRSTAIGEQSSESIAENFQRKPLLASNEANKLFASIGDTGHAVFPGLALIKISGQDPILVRKVNYDQDEAFVRSFDPHPAHPFIPYKAAIPAPPPPPPTPELSFARQSRSAPRKSENLDKLENLAIEGFKSYKATATKKVDLPAKDIWLALLQMEWPMGLRSWDPIPHPYTIGTPIFARSQSTESEEVGFVIKCSEFSNFAIFYGRIESFELKDIGNNSCEVSFSITTFEKPRMFRDYDLAGLESLVHQNLEHFSRNFLGHIRQAYQRSGFDSDQIPDHLLYEVEKEKKEKEKILKHKPPRKKSEPSRDKCISIRKNDLFIRSPMRGIVRFIRDSNGKVIYRGGRDIHRGSTSFYIEDNGILTAVIFDRSVKIAKIIAEDGQNIRVGEEIMKIFPA